MKNILHVIFVFAFVLAFTLAIATVGLPAPARSAPSPPPPALAVEEKIDLSGEWSGTQGLRDDFAVKQTGDWVRLEPTCWASATGLLKGRVLHVQFDFVPADGNYRYVARLELIGDELIGVFGRSDKVKWDAAGNMTGDVEPMKLQRVKPDGSP